MAKWPWTQKEISAVQRMYCVEALDDEEIAAVLGRTKGSISNCRQTHAITRPSMLLKSARRWSDAELEKARTMYAAGAARAEIAEVTGRSLIAIKRAVTTFNWCRSEYLPVDPSEFDTPDEIWRKASAIAGVAISSKGRVKKLTPNYNIYAVWIDRDGYVHVTLPIDGKQRRRSVHRLVALAFLGAPPSERHQVAHNDGNPSNNMLANLRWATPAENQRDRLLHGTALRMPNGRFIKSEQARAARVPVMEISA